MKSEIIRYSAYVLMIYDHICAIWFPEYLFLRFPSAIVFPIFCWFAVVAINNTKNIGHYLSGLILLALLSQYPFQFALGVGKYNDIIWLALGVGVMWFAREKKSNFIIILSLVACAVANLRGGFVAIAIMAMVNAGYNYLPELTRAKNKTLSIINYAIYPAHFLMLGALNQII
jgi:hypothetical protein